METAHQLSSRLLFSTVQQTSKQSAGRQCVCVYVTTHLTTLRERCVYRIVFYRTIINNNPQCLPLIHPAHSIHWIWHSSCIIPQLVHSAFRVSRFYFIFPTFEFMFCYFSFSCLFLVPHASGEVASTALFCHALIVVYIEKCLSIYWEFGHSFSRNAFGLIRIQ